MCRRIGLKFNAGKSKVMELGGEDGEEVDWHREGLLEGERFGYQVSKENDA